MLAERRIYVIDQPERFVLLNPGPVTLTETVRQSMTKRDMCHREPDFSELMRDIRRRLCSVYDGTDDWTSVLVTGSGTAAVESMVSSLIRGAGTALVAANGVYGERMAKMLTCAQKQPHVVQSDWQAPIDFAAVQQQLQAEPAIEHVIAVHHETTTGRLNDLRRLAEICSRYGKRMLIDTVSSFGGEAIDFDNWPIDAVAATANKCLHGITGIAFVLVRKELMLSPRSQSSSLYLDMATNFAAQENGFPAFTPAIQSMYALQQALIELSDTGGWQARNETYRKRSQLVTAAFQQMGIQTLLPDPADHSSVLTAYRLPTGKRYEQISQPLQHERIVIYAGQKELERIIFRVAVMGDLQDKDLEKMLSIVRQSSQ